ncbi:MAG: iron-containing alcohol dehydrogenase [Firmicutes bacterium]|nr:iron-containing alcohol dehydrogenase [Bacillota bacterium]
MRQLPGLVELDAGSGGVRLDHTALPRAAERIVFGRGLGGRVVSEAVVGLVDPSRAAVLLVVGVSSSKAPAVAALVDGLRRLAGGTPALRVEICTVHGHADHDTVRAGIAAVKRSGAGLVVAIGGGTTIDVAKSVAALARQGDEEGADVAVNVDVDVDVAAFHLGRRHVAAEKALPWVAVPTTSGTGSESTDNAVIELGDEKRSLRGIPAPRLIVADPALTDSLPLAPTVVAAVDALAQALEVLTNAGASPKVQEVALAAFATLARGIEDLYLVATRRIGGTGSDSGSSDDPAARSGPEDLAHPGQPSDRSGRRSFETAPVIRDADFQRGCGGAAGLSPLNPAEPDHPVEPGPPAELGETSQTSQRDRFGREDHPPRVNPSPVASERPASAMSAASSTSAAEVAATTRDTLCWGSLLMGIAFAHARLGLPHALVHFCNRFSLSHGNMVGMLLAPGLAVQARDPETARRLARAAQALDKVLRCREVPAPEGTAPESPISQTSVPGGSELLFRWLATRIAALFAATGLPHSLRAAGLTRADLDWIVARELESQPSFGTPARPATPGELKEVLERAFNTG